MELIMCGGGNGARFVRKLSWIRGSLPKIRESCWGISPPKPEPGVVGDGSASPPKPMPGIGQRVYEAASADEVDAKVVWVRQVVRDGNVLFGEREGWSVRKSAFVLSLPR